MNIVDWEISCYINLIFVNCISEILKFQGNFNFVDGRSNGVYLTAQISMYDAIIHFSLG